MSKISCWFKGRELYAIKHALQRSVVEKENRLMVTPGCYIEIKEKLRKDIEQEKGLADKIDEIINSKISK